MFLETREDGEISSPIVPDIVYEFGLSLRDSSRLIKYYRRHRTELLKALSIFDEDTILSSLTHSDDDSSRSRESECTWTCDDENTHERHDSRDKIPNQNPYQKRHNG